MTPTAYTLIVDDTAAGMRLDKFLVTGLPEYSRSRLKGLIEEGHVSCNEKPARDVSAKVKAGQHYDIIIPEVKLSYLLPQEIPLAIVYEDEHFLVIDKPPGLTVHPGAGNPDRTLVNALLSHCGDSLSGIGGVARPGIVHRIDKDTSGLLVVAKHDAAHIALSDQLAKRSLKRTYTALVWGAPQPARGTITGNIGRSSSNRKKMAVVRSGGKPATTHYKVVRLFPARSADLAMEQRRTRRADGSATSLSPSLFSVVECQLETGRTHQIRVHLTHAGHPLVGDPVYGQTTKQRLNANAYKSLPAETKEALLAFQRQALHAAALELVHPATGKKMQFTCDLPADMQSLIKTLS